MDCLHHRPLTLQIKFIKEQRKTGKEKEVELNLSVKVLINSSTNNFLKPTLTGGQACSIYKVIQIIQILYSLFLNLNFTNRSRRNLSFPLSTSVPLHANKTFFKKKKKKSKKDRERKLHIFSPLLFEVHDLDMENYLMKEVASELLHCSQVLSTRYHWYHNWRLESFPKFDA